MEIASGQQTAFKQYVYAVIVLNTHDIWLSRCLIISGALFLAKDPKFN